MAEQTLEQIAQAVADMRTANDQALAELKSKGFTDPLLKSQVEKANAAIDQLIEKHKKTEAELKAAQERQGALEAAMKRPGFGKADGPKIDEKALAAFQMMFGAEADWAQHKAAVSQYMRNGRGPIEDLQAKAMSVDSNQDGGFLVMPDTSGRIVQQVYETSPMRQLASVQTISTDALEGIYDLDEASVGWVGERDTRSETNTPKVNMWRIPVHEIYAEPRATQKLLDDAGVDVEAWLAGKVSDKFARAEAAAFVTGDGDKKPRGFLTYATSANVPGATTWNFIQFTNTGQASDFASTDPADVFITCHGLLKAPYLANARWAMNRTTLAHARKLKTANDEAYLLQMDFRAGLNETILGYPVERFEDMPSYNSSGALAIAFGDFRAAYQIVDRIGIRVLRDPFTAKPWVKFYTTKRVGGDVVNFEALKVIRFGN